jgi:hypothetical protein
MSESAMSLKPGFNVFISYGREDQALADRIVRGLTFGGRVRVLTDRYVTSSGQQWREGVRRALEAADVFMVVGSPASARADHVLHELGGAWALGKPIVIVTPEGEVEWAPPIEASSYTRAALTELEKPALAEALLETLTRQSDRRSEP